MLETRGVRVFRVPVDGRGVVDPERVARAVGPATRLVSVMLANNETGALQPVAAIARLARQANPAVLVHTDAAQAVGKIPVNVDDLRVDLLTIAGHKLYAPKGVGALFVRKGVHLAPVFGGGGQEWGVRPGTENIPYMVALGQACSLAGRDLDAEGRRQRELGELFLRGLAGLVDMTGPGVDARKVAGSGVGVGTGAGPGVEFRLHSEGAPRLPQTMSIGFRGFAAGDILSELVGLDVSVSGGAACHAGEVKVSHVLAAMGVPQDYSAGTIRFSWGRLTTRDDVEELVRRLTRVFKNLPRP
jgi:cysteine desulfurase